VPDVKRILALAVGAATGAFAATAALRRLRRGREPTGPDPRAEELRRKLAEARESAAAEDDLDAEGTLSEPLVEERTTRSDSPVVPRGDDVEEARRRIHEEGRAAAEDMRGGGQGEEG
jgi:hypothetical protein